MQYAARLAALSSEIDDTLAALDQLDADNTEHAELLATYHDQARDNHIGVLFHILIVCIIALQANTSQHSIRIPMEQDAAIPKIKTSMAFDLIHEWRCLKAALFAGGRVVSTRSKQSGV